ncbi:Cro/CI family transcriptional regulator [uncultured Paraglaciecola sp.]|uniref:Cro/CI family transcriptional regulator n=1 Tax=uncultured Paraglaciecola sp. TaxID=1765024 RepID=UPI00260E2823|nr:Cro/CI family transcriptional regulator [uncultured Paraglaciecola sp.]
MTKRKPPRITEEISLEDYVNQYSHSSAARVIGCHRSAIGQMLKAQRKIWFELYDDGSHDCYEISRPGRNRQPVDLSQEVS